MLLSDIYFSDRNYYVIIFNIKSATHHALYRFTYKDVYERKSAEWLANSTVLFIRNHNKACIYLVDKKNYIKKLALASVFSSRHVTILLIRKY